MAPTTARTIAHYSHLDQRTRQGVPVTEHVERVAAAVSDEARTVAYLHDVLERTTTAGDELLAQGLTPLEGDALALLTRGAGESYELHVHRIAHAPGDAGRLAREVKLADLEDHLSVPHRTPGEPPYAWARRHILAGRIRRGDVARTPATPLLRRKGA